ncbi:protein MEI2-like 4 isoform X2 [Magnolia sinica]|uniref:protein MEI2-like 4 isoform X2 n=1 Tax=Magnolia sinica TaxID=86752 RepID=UPI00265A1BEC|nr:protein MEI2-like 4 isoform X2 [Magnolia sinica]
MPFEVMDQRGLYGPSSFFSEEICFPTERQIGFWKPESMPDHQGVGMEGISLVSRKKSDTSSLLERHLVNAERTSSLSMTSWKVTNRDIGSHSNLYMQPASYFVEGNKVDLDGSQYENGLFSSSLSDIFKKKLRLSSNDIIYGQSVDTITSQFEEDEPYESLKEIEAQTIGDLLPDDDDLLSGIIDELEYIAQPNTGDDRDEFDLFSSVGGMELEADNGLSCYGGSRSSDFIGAIPNGQQGGSNSPFAGEHPYGEHPSRTLFVRNINSNVDDAELRMVFEQYGDIRTLYTACKHRGFVMISYYDIRAARNAMRALQNKPLRRRKLDIHFSIPKDNPSDKDINQGTLVVFNLDSSVSNDELRQIFGVYGEIKEIRETPHKRHHKFIEFYDVRAAEAALHALNRSDIAGKQIKLEPSRPGGARRSLMQQFSPELEQEEAGGFSPPNSSPPGGYGPVPHEPIRSGCLDNGAIDGLHSALRPPISPFIESAFHGISSSVLHSLSSPVGVASVGNHGTQAGLDEHRHSLDQMKSGFQHVPNFRPHSLPEYHHDGVSNGVPAMPASMNSGSGPTEGIANRHILRVGSGGSNSHPFDINKGGKCKAFSAGGNGSCPLHGHHYAWSNSNSYHHHHPPSPMMWPSSPSFVNGIHAHPGQQMHGLLRAPSHMLQTVMPLHHPHHHHVGSAPVINSSLWDRQHAYAAEPTEASAFHPGSIGSVGFSSSSTFHPLDLVSRSIFPHVGGNCIDPSIPSPNVGLPSPQQRAHMFPGRDPMIPMPTLFDAPNERIRSRRNDASLNQADRKQYELDISRILHGEDTRTTLMIKNIPNKYTSKMLLATIDEHHQGTYDFIYLPIDFKNKCNVGYAFINMIDPMQIVPFFQAFNGKKWEKFNSEKVASLAYARIQGKAALIAHFQNSSLMNEDKRCRPILFHSDGPNAGNQEPFPMGLNIRSRPGRTRSNSNEENHHQGSPPPSAIGEESNSGTDSSSGSSKGLE